MLSFFASEMIDATLVTVAAGSYSSGIYSPGAETTATIKVIAPQPLSPNEKQMLPSGELERNYLKTWTESAITGWGTQDPDKIVVASKTYKIMEIGDRSTLGNFYRIVIREEKPNE